MNILRMKNRKNKLMKKEVKFLPGLTLVEMIISLSVVMIITAIFIVNYRGTNKKTDLIMASQGLVADIHQAQSRSLGLLQYGDQTPAGGWGVHFDLNNPNQYIIFADLDGPGEYGDYMEYDPETEGNTDNGARVVELSSELELTNLVVGNSSRSTANVTFLPPDPRTNINSGGTTSTEMQISVKDLRDGSIRRVKINFLGLAEVIN